MSATASHSCTMTDTSNLRPPPAAATHSVDHRMTPVTYVVRACMVSHSTMADISGLSVMVQWAVTRQPCHYSGAVQYFAYTYLNK